MHTWSFRPATKKLRRQDRTARHNSKSRFSRLGLLGLEPLEARTLLAADLQVTETAAPVANVSPGQLLDYTITIHNAGDATASASNDTFTDTLPANVTLVSVSNSSGSVTGSSNTSVTGSIGSLAAGASDTIHVRVTPNTSALGALINTVTVSGTDADANAANNTASASNVAVAAVTPIDLSVTGTSTVDGSAANFGTPVDANNATTNPGNNAALVGQDITYNYTVTNNGATSASNVQLTEMSPAAGVFLSAATNQGTVSFSNGVVTANLGTLAPGASATVTVDLSPTTAGANATNAGLTDTAFATTDSGDSNLANNSASVGSLVNAASATVPNGNNGTNAANLTITKTDSAGAAGAVPGEAVTYTITVTNNATDPLTGTAANVALFDTLPNGMTFVSASGGSGSIVQFNNGTVTDSLSDLFPGASATLTIVASPTTTTSGQVTNRVVATSDSGFASATTQLATDTLNVAAAGAGAAGLAVTKTDSSAGTLTPGQAVTYTITVTNTGATNSANDVVLTDNLPTGMIYVSALSAAGGVAGGPAGTTTQINNNVTDTIGTLAPGQSATLTLVTSPTQSGAVSNTAVATTTSGVTSGSTPQATDTITVGQPGAGAANLSINKLHSPVGQPITFGQNVTYTISVTNNGATPANNVVVTDNFPAGITYGSSSSSTGTTGGTLSSNGTTANSNGNVTDTIATLPAGQTATFTIIGSPNQGGTFANRATVTSSSGLTTPISNVATDSLSVPTPDTVSVTGSATVMGVTAGNTNPALTGQDVTFTFVVTNNSSTASAGGVMLTDVVPAGATFLSSSSSQGSVSQSAGTTTANLGTLAAGASATVTIDLSANSAGTLTDTANVTTGNGDSSPNTSATATAPVNAPASGAAANLTITKTDSVGAAGTITPGQLVTYTITVTNNATDPLTGTAAEVVLHDALPSGVTLVSASPGQGTFGATGSVTVNNGTVTDALSDVLPGETEVLTIVVTPTVAGTVSNQVIASSDSGFGNASNQTANDTFTVSPAATTAAGLTVTKTDSVGMFGTAVPGQAVTYTIMVTNSGATNTANNVVLSDSLPTGMTFVSATSAAGAASGSPAGTATQANGVVTDNVGTLAPGQSTTMTLVAVPTQSGLIVNTAVATTSSGIDKSSNTVATDALNVAVAPTTAADLSVTKIDSAVGTSITPGQPLTYTITVTNNSATNAASNIVVTDNLPAGLTYTSSSSSMSAVSAGGTPPTGAAAGTTANANGVVTDTIPTLAPGQVATFQIVVSPTQSGPITNTAVATTTSGALNPQSLAATDTVIVAPIPPMTPNLIITKTATPSPATIGQPLTYTITIANNGGAAAANVVVTDALASGATFSSEASSAGTISQANGTVTANLGTIAAGATDTVTIVVSPTQAGTLDNTASLTTTSANANSTTMASTSVMVDAVTSSGASLSISKIASPSPGTVGQPLTYTITVTNSGAADAANVVITDMLAQGLTFVSDSTTVGSATFNNGTVSDSLGTVAAGATDTLTIVVTPTQAGSVLNTANVTTTSTNNNPNTSAAITTTINGTSPPTPPVNSAPCYLEGQPGDGTDATFVHNLYRELLGREPDTNGQNLFVNFLAGHGDAGGRLDVISVFMHSPEYVNHLVECIYETFLGRAADAGGLAFWAGLLANGAGEKNVLDGIIGSPEYFADQSGNAKGFVTGLYRDILGRVPDAGGNAYWVGRVNMGPGGNDGHDSLAQIVSDFLGAPESEHKLLDGNYATLTGSVTPVAAGSPAGGHYALADLTGNGWDNLYFGGNINPALADQYFNQLQSNASFEAVMDSMLDSSHYYNAAT